MKTDKKKEKNDLRNFIIYNFAADK